MITSRYRLEDARQAFLESGSESEQIKNVFTI